MMILQYFEDYYNNTYTQSSGKMNNLHQTAKFDDESLHQPVFTEYHTLKKSTSKHLGLSSVFSLSREREREREATITFLMDTYLTTIMEIIISIYKS